MGALGKLLAFCLLLLALDSVTGLPYGRVFLFLTGWLLMVMGVVWLIGAMASRLWQNRGR